MVFSEEPECKHPLLQHLRGSLLQCQVAWRCSPAWRGTCGPPTSWLTATTPGLPFTAGWHRCLQVRMLPPAGLAHAVELRLISHSHLPCAAPA